MAETKAKLKLQSEADTSAFGKFKNSIASLETKIKDAAGKMAQSLKSGFSQLTNIKSLIDLTASAWGKLRSVMSKSFDAETMEVQFKTLIGSADEAREHMKMLQEMGDTPPFSMEEFAAASKELLVFTDGALGFKDSLTVIGDAASATGKPMETIADAVGKAFAALRDNQDVGMAAKALKNLGVITPEVAAELKNMQQSGSDSVEIWDKLWTSLQKYSGAMDETLETGNGLIGAIGSQWDDILREFGGVIMDAVKGPLTKFLGILKDLREDGSIEQWAQRAVSALKPVGKVISLMIDGFGYMKELYSNTKDYFERVGEGLGEAIGGGSYEEGYNRKMAEQNDLRDEELAAQRAAKIEREKRMAVEKEVAEQKEALRKTNERQRITNVLQNKPQSKTTQNKKDEDKELIDSINRSAQNYKDAVQKEIDAKKEAVDKLKEKLDEVKKSSDNLAKEIKESSNNVKNDTESFRAGDRREAREKAKKEKEIENRQKRRDDFHEKYMKRIRDNVIENGGKVVGWKDNINPIIDFGSTNLSKKEREQFTNWVKNNRLEYLKKQNEKEQEDLNKKIKTNEDQIKGKEKDIRKNDEERRKRINEIQDGKRKDENAQKDNRPILVGMDSATRNRNLRRRGNRMAENDAEAAEALLEQQKLQREIENHSNLKSIKDKIDAFIDVQTVKK